MAIANGEAKFGFQTPQTVIAHQIYALHLIVLGIVVVIAVAVFGVLSYVIVRHPRQRGDDRDGRNFLYAQAGARLRTAKGERDDYEPTSQQSR